MPDIQPPTKSQTRFDVELIKKLYIDEKKSLREIGEAVGCSCQRVLQLLREHEVPIRAKGEARKIALRAGKFEGMFSIDVNEAFFETWTPQMAWVLGLLWSDGSLYRGPGAHRIVLTITDEDVVRKTAAHLGYLGEPRRMEPSGLGKKPLFCLAVCSKPMFDSLAALGLTPRKTRTKPFPAVPDEFLPHFVRGYLDGNGYYGKSAGGACNTVHVVTGSEQFAQGLTDRLFGQGFGRTRGGERPAPIKVMPGGLRAGMGAYEFADSYAVYWCGPTAAALREWLYRDATPETCMERKAIKM